MAAERFSHYRIEHVIGQGMAGTVHAARDTRDDRAVALKVLRPELCHPRLGGHFVREMTAVAAVHATGLAQMIEAGEADGRLFIASEWLEGESLAARLERGPLAMAGVVHIGIAVLEALAVLHAHGMAHRDLKPTNLFLCTSRRVVVLDAGLIAALSWAGPPSVAVATIEATMAAPRWLAPEQARGAPADARTDLFVLGALLREAVSGERAFEADGSIEQMYAVLHESVAPLEGTSAQIVLGRVLERAMRKRPEARYRDAVEMAAELREVPVDGVGFGRTARRAEARARTSP